MSSKILNLPKLRTIGNNVRATEFRVRAEIWFVAKLHETRYRINTLSGKWRTNVANGCGYFGINAIKLMARSLLAVSGRCDRAFKIGLRVLAFYN